ncbi:sulfotransferase family protein [Roseobacter sinensis]|uniref:Sulfotransferase n=1 Tax=Roseobacter sinensis TaxID=2931391 RepID=A0ABT3BIK3_9RHOB|nr:sulfotransferase [Roseobacter sp. WL0113]MCV3273400.1 sulfotransferase [Roseobacter sp. WL0113]
MHNTQRYFVGIGAQRAGTTWLARMFDRHPDIGMSPVKETHYWSSKYVDHQRNSVRGLQAMKIRMPQLLRHCRAHPGETLPWISAYLGMMAHRDASYRTFIERGRYGCPVAGEITPAYATLPKEAFAALDGCLAQPRYIFILRNPADRFISQIAHTADRDASVLRTPLSELLAQPYFAMRSSYEATYLTCRSVVDADRLHVLFYEDLFGPQTAQPAFDALCAFLGVPSMAVDIAEVVNARPRPEHGAAREEIVALLQNDYLFARDSFPDALPSSWISDLALMDGLPRDRAAAPGGQSC